MRKLLTMVALAAMLTLTATWEQAFSVEPGGATNGQQIYFHGPRGTGQVSVTGLNQNDIVSTWTGTADVNGNAFTSNWWFKGNVEIRFVFDGRLHVRTSNVPGSGAPIYHIYN